VYRNDVFVVAVWGKVTWSEFANCRDCCPWWQFSVVMQVECSVCEGAPSCSSGSSDCLTAWPWRWTWVSTGGQGAPSHKAFCSTAGEGVQIPRSIVIVILVLFNCLRNCYYNASSANVEIFVDVFDIFYGRHECKWDLRLSGMLRSVDW